MKALDVDHANYLDLSSDVTAFLGMGLLTKEKIKVGPCFAELLVNYLKTRATLTYSKTLCQEIRIF